MGDVSLGGLPTTDYPNSFDALTVSMEEDFAYHPEADFDAAQRISCCHIMGLFAPHQTSVPVIGALSTLWCLQEAIEQRGLQVLRPSFDTIEQLVIRSSAHLRRDQIFPDEQTLQVLLFQLEQQRMGNKTAASQTKQVEKGSPFQTDCVTPLLESLSRIASYQLHTDGWQPLYSVGVLTMELEGAAPSFHAQIFHLNENAPDVPTDTIWLYRYLAPSEPQGPDHEYWRVISIDPDQQGGHHHGTQDLDHALNSNNLLPTASPAHFNFTPAQILDSDPATVVQSAILTVAPFYSNTAIWERLNHTLVADGKAPIKHANNITRRITVALEIRAREMGVAVAEVRADLDRARIANGVRCRAKALQ